MTLIPPPPVARRVCKLYHAVNMSNQCRRFGCMLQASAQQQAGTQAPQLAACQHMVGYPSWHRYMLRLPLASLTPSATYSSTAQLAAAGNHALVVSSLDTCLKLVYAEAAAQAAVKEGQQAAQTDTAAATRDWAEFLRRHERTNNDRWQYVRCGDWEAHSSGWTGINSNVFCPTTALISAILPSL